MSKFFRFPYALNGDKTSIGDTLDVSGLETYQEGRGADYARDPATDPLVKLINRAMDNQFKFDVTENLKIWQTNNYPNYITATDNGGTPYAYDIGVIVRFDDGGGIKVYQNNVAGNTNDPSVSGWSIYKTQLKTYATMASLIADASNLENGSVVYLESFHAGIKTGIHYKVNTSGDLTLHDGGKYIDVSNTADLTLWDSAAQAVWFTAGTGTGVVIEAIGKFDIYPEYYGAFADGSTLDTLAFQATVDNNTVTKLTPSAYVTDGLVIGAGKKILGSGKVQTTIVTDDLVNPLFTHGDRCHFEGFFTFYSGQILTGTPVVYPPTFTSDGISGTNHITVRDILAYNNYILFDYTSVYAGNIDISDIWGFPLRSFLKADFALDTIKVSDLHLNPNFVPYAGDVTNWVFNNGVVLDFGRVDSFQMTQFLCYGYSDALILNTGLPSGSSNMITISNGLFDVFKHQVTGNAYQDGVFFNNVVFTSTTVYQTTTVSNPGFDILGPVSYPINFTNCSFRNYRLDIFNISGNVKFNHCTLDDWNLIGTTNNYAAIKTIGTGATVVIDGVTFEGRSNGNNRAIFNDGTTTANIKISNSEFKGTVANDFYILNARLKLSNNDYNVGSIYNNVPALDINSTLATYNTPTFFAGSGPWLQGDRFTQQLSAVGADKAWVCTVAGTPGTWVSEGLL